MTPRDRCAEAIAETYRRYSVIETGDYHIARHAARACLEALLPVNADEDQMTEIVTGYSPFSPSWHSFRIQFTAAIWYAMGDICDGR